MTKRKIDDSSSLGNPEESSPHILNSKSADNSNHPPPPTKEEMEEWDNVKCPVCMDHPNNAVLLICSSHTKGCHPYMCNTSHRHFHCFSQFRKSHSQAPNAIPCEHEGKTQPHINLPGMLELKQSLTCPLCRGLVSGWIVVQAARDYMNAKIKSCASETCDFTGNYRDLRIHARVKHPRIRPSMVDLERSLNWIQIEREGEIQELSPFLHPEHLDQFSQRISNILMPGLSRIENSLDILTQQIATSQGLSSRLQNSIARLTQQFARSQFNPNVHN